MSRNKLYGIILTACISGYIWLYLGIQKGINEINSVEVCLWKHITNIPCPSCGSTRSVFSLINGDFIKSLLINPFGLFITLIMLIVPLWITLDIITKRKSLFDCYQKFEQIIKKPQFAIPLVILVIINWIWNITKGL
ncbi:DUF2752 domain-containing protein [Saccharicrinis carchari]|uniref:DUF2752 domain-containing protein n=1 Tax=Saccharicrinis carchari TaxID=1168039 RepID=UPI0011596CA4